MRIIHLVKDGLHFRKEITGGQPTFRDAPVVAVHLADFYSSFLERIPYLARSSVNKLGSELDGNVAAGFVLSKDASADSIPCSQDADGKAGASEFAGVAQSGNARANDDYGWIFCHSKKLSGM